MKNNCFFLLVLLLAIPGCGGGKKTSSKPKSKPSKKEIMSEINVPLAGDTIKSFFNEDLEEFELVDDSSSKNDQTKTAAVVQPQADDFSWVEEVESNNFKTVYFDFDNYDVKNDQHDSVAYDIEMAKKMIAKGERPTIIIEGHACHSAGSRTYNLALSERRAKNLADRFVNAGIPREYIKIVPRGAEVVAHDKNGKPVTGSREQQWPNRRDEIRIIYS